MAIRSWLVTVSVLVEEDTKDQFNGPQSCPREQEIEDAILAAVASVGDPATSGDAVVSWQSTWMVLLDHMPHCGRCAVCSRWVYDGESQDSYTPTGISRGAVVAGDYRCDEHLPTGHPLCFAGKGYDGPLAGQ